jgi:uncharacterized protein YajQ (UPF0234 family)
VGSKMKITGAGNNSNISLREIDSSYDISLDRSSESFNPNKMIYVYSKEEMQLQGDPSN